MQPSYSCDSCNEHDVLPVIRSAGSIWYLILQCNLCEKAWTVTVEDSNIIVRRAPTEDGINGLPDS